MQYYDIKEAQKLTAQNNKFVLGEHEAGRKHFENKFELQVKGRGKSKKDRLQHAETVEALGLMSASDETLVVDPEAVAAEMQKSASGKEVALDPTGEQKERHY